MLYIYLVKRNISEDGGPEFDATHGFVIAAHHVEEAKMFASSYRKGARDGRHRDDDPEVWFKKTTTYEVIGTAAIGYVIEPGVILEDHQWG